MAPKAIKHSREFPIHMFVHSGAHPRKFASVFYPQKQKHKPPPKKEINRQPPVKYILPTIFPFLQIPILAIKATVSISVPVIIHPKLHWWATYICTGQLWLPEAKGTGTSSKFWRVMCMTSGSLLYTLTPWIARSAPFKTLILLPLVIVKSNVEIIMRGRIVGSFFLIMGDADAAAPLAMAKANRIVDATTLQSVWEPWTMSMVSGARLARRALGGWIGILVLQFPLL